MNIYDLVNEIDSSRLENHWDIFSYSFNQSNRAKLDDEFDLEVFNILKKAYRFTIIYRSDRRDCDSKIEYRNYGDEEIVAFTDTELKVLRNLDWTRLPHNLKAHIYDVIWLLNHEYKAAEITVEEYYNSYCECFDEVYWTQCVNYISRAIELATKLGLKDKKENFLISVYNDVVKLNGNDSSFLSISLIELLVSFNYHCGFNTLIPFVDRIILINEGCISTAQLLERAYYVKANLYKKLNDTTSANSVYIQYADSLMMSVERLVKII